MMVHGQRRDNKWHPYTSCMFLLLITRIAFFDATGVGVPFIIPPLPMNHLPWHRVRSNEREQPT
jgi:hypothetical protein